jgi:hypothetical protein
MQIAVADNTVYKATKTGSIHIRVNNILINISDVIFVPGLKRNLISVKALMRKGLDVSFSNNVCEIKSCRGSIILLGKEGSNGLYHLIGDVLKYHQQRPAEATELSLIARQNNDFVLKIWHARMAHSSYTYLEKALSQNLVKPIPGLLDKMKAKIVDQFCIDCEKGKAHKKQGSGGTRSRSVEFGRKFHLDLFGPVSVSSKRGNKYFIGLYNNTAILINKSSQIVLFLQDQNSIRSRLIYSIR